MTLTLIFCGDVTVKFVFPKYAFFVILPMPITATTACMPEGILEAVAVLWKLEKPTFITEFIVGNNKYICISTVSFRSALSCGVRVTLAGLPMGNNLSQLIHP